jgi:hypothetical protein
MQRSKPHDQPRYANLCSGQIIRTAKGGKPQQIFTHQRRSKLSILRLGFLLFSKGRHYLTREAPQATPAAFTTTRSSTVDQHISHTGGLQILQPPRDLIGRAIDRT